MVTATTASKPTLPQLPVLLLASSRSEPKPFGGVRTAGTLSETSEALGKSISLPNTEKDVWNATASPVKKRRFSVKHAAYLGAALLLGGGLRRAIDVGRITKSSDKILKILPGDWKDYFLAGTAFVGVNEFNKAIDRDPPPAIRALEITALVQPLLVGLSRKSLVHFMVMAPLFAGVVQGVDSLNHRFGKWVDKRPAKTMQQKELTKAEERLLVSVTAGVVMALAYPKIFKFAAKALKSVAEHPVFQGKLNGFFETASKEETKGEAGFWACSAGCCPIPVCFIDFMDILGGLFGTLTGKKTTQNSETPPVSNSIRTFAG